MRPSLLFTSIISSKIDDNAFGALVSYNRLYPTVFQPSFNVRGTIDCRGSRLLFPNDSCILAIGGIKNTPVVKNGEIVPGNIMKVTMSCDHRLVDGATGAKFLKTLKELLEDPIKILV